MTSTSEWPTSGSLGCEKGRGGGAGRGFEAVLAGHAVFSGAVCGFLAKLLSMARPTKLTSWHCCIGRSLSLTSCSLVASCWACNFPGFWNRSHQTDLPSLSLSFPLPSFRRPVPRLSRNFRATSAPSFRAELPRLSRAMRGTSAGCRTPSWGPSAAC